MGRKLALIVGNSQYTDEGLARLSAPDADVHALADVLRAESIGAFDAVESLVNESFAHTRRAIARFFDDRKRDDLLLLYSSGHGVRDEYGHLHLAVRDTERSLLAATAIEAAFISECMDRSASKRLVLVLDCCHSGAFSYGSKAAQGASVGTAVAFEGTGRGRIVLTATDATQYAWEGDTIVGTAQPSVFTRHVTEGLRTGAADLDGDGVVTIDELYEYVYDQVLNDTAKQTPGKWAFGQQGEIVIARNPATVENRGEAPKARFLAARAEHRSQRVDTGPATESGFAAFMGAMRSRIGHPVAVAAALATAVLMVIVAQSGLMQQPVTPATVAQRDAQPVPTPTQAAGGPISEIPTPQVPPTAAAATPGASGAGGVAASRRPNARPAESPRRPGSTPGPVTRSTPEPPAERSSAPATITTSPVAAAPAPAPAPANDVVVAAPPPSRPTTVTVSTDTQIESALTRYTQARSRMDVDELKEVWPTAPVASLRRVYAGIASETVQLTKCTRPAAEGATASVECDEHVRSKFTTGSGDTRTTRATFSLRRDNDRWVITQIKRR